MAAEILVPPENVWGVFMANGCSILENSEQVIATNQEYGVEICLASEQGFPVVYVYMDSEPVESEYIYSQANCEASVRNLYDKYLSGNVVNTVLTDGDTGDESDGFDEISQLRWDDMMAVREGELDDAVLDLLNTLEPDIDIMIEDIPDFIEDLKDHLCEYLYIRYGISVYRPMVLENDDGSDYYTDYPYPELDFSEA